MSSKDRTTETRWGPESPAPGDESLRLPAVPAAAPLPAPPGWPCHQLLCWCRGASSPGRAAPDTTPERQAAHPRLSPLTSQEETCPQPQRGNCLSHEWLWESWDLPLGTASTWATCLCSSSGKRPFLYKNTPNSFYLQP